jgi:hypothetical protein
MSRLGDRMLEREIRIALAVTVILLAATLLLQVVTGQARWLDFGGYYATGLIVRDGATARLYDQPLQIQYQEQALDRQKGDLIFIAPPFEALIFVPLSFLPYGQAYLIFGLINIAIWVWLALRTHRWSGLPPFRHFAMCFAGLPLWRTLHLGELSFLVLALLTLCIVSLSEGRDFKAGIWAGLLLLRFQLVLPLVAVWLLHKRWRSLAGMMIPAVAYIAISFRMLGWTGILDYIRMLSTINHHITTDSSAWQMPTLRAFFSTVLPADLATVATITAVSGLLLWIIRRWRDMDLKQGFAALLIATVITAGYAQVYDLSLVFLAFLIYPSAANSRFAIAVSIYMWIAFLIAESVRGANVLWPFLAPLLAGYAVMLLGPRLPQIAISEHPHITQSK